MHITPHLGIGDLLILKMIQISNNLDINNININQDLVFTFSENYEEKIKFITQFIEFLFPDTKYCINNNPINFNPINSNYKIVNNYIYDSINNSRNINFENKYSDYIIFHTKMRHDGLIDKFNEEILSDLNLFLRNFKTTKIILFDSCWFDFYYVGLFGLIDNQIPYHLDSLIDCYKKNYSIDKYIEDCVNNVNFKTNEDLENIAINSLIELNNRYNKAKNIYTNTENVYVMTIHDYVKENYKKKLLFYSMNHPSKYIFQYICEEIIKYLQIKNTINYNIDPLNSIRCVLYKCIQNNVDFNICDHTPLICNESDIYRITQLYYNNYNNLDVYKLIANSKLY